MTFPRTVGRYELVTPLAAGSLGGLWMSRVASGPEEGRVVTVRSIERPAALTDSALSPLTAVGFSAMELRHPAVAAVLDVVVAGGAIAIVSEHLEGTLLSGICQQGARAKVSPGVAARIALDLLEGLVAVKPAWDEVAPPPPSGTSAASPPSIHGGLLPDGVLVATFGEAMILEIGVAAAAMSIQALRDKAEVLAYRAPEQLGEGGGSPDERADVFTLGAMIWELIAGRPLFGLPPAPPPPAGAPPPPRSAGAATVRRNLTSAPIPRLDALPGIQPVSPALADFVQKCLERDRTRRHQTLSEAADALRKLGVAAPHQEVASLLVSLRSQPGEAELTPASTRATSPPEDRETMAPETRRPVNADGGGASPAGTGPREDAKTLSVPPIPGDAPRAARESTLSVEPESVEPVSAERMSAEPVSVEPVSAEPATAPKPAGGRPTSIRPRSFVPKDLHPKGGKAVSQPPPAAGDDIPPPPPAFFSALESLPPPSGANFFPAPETASAVPVVKPPAPAAAAARVASAPPEKRSGGGKIAIVVVAVVAVIVIALLVLRSGSDEARPEPAPAKANVASPAATPRAPEPAPAKSGTVEPAAPVAPSAAPEPEAPAEPASPPAGSAAPSEGMAAAPAPAPGAPTVRLQPLRPASSAAKKPFRPSDI